MQSETIVIVDDDDSNLRALGAILRRKGYEPLGSTDPRAALHVIESVAPGLIIANLLMESMNGFEMSELVHAMPHLADVPVVLMSTQANYLPFQGRSSHLRSFLTKPVQPDEVLRLVGSILPIGQSASRPAAVYTVQSVNEP